MHELREIWRFKIQIRKLALPHKPQIDFSISTLNLQVREGIYLDA